MATLKDLKELFAYRQPHEVAIEVNGFTGFRTTLLEELTQEEVDRLYTIHQGFLLKKKELSEEEYLQELLLKKKWRANILAIATEEGIKEPDSWTKFNHWMLNSSKFKKQLNAHSLDELKELHKQFCRLRENNACSAQKPMTKAWERKAHRLKMWN